MQVSENGAASARQPSHGARTLALLFAMLFPTFAAWLYFVQYSGRSMAALYSITKVLQFGFPLFWAVWLQKRTDFLRTHGSAHLPGIIFGFGIGALIVLLYYFVFRGSPMFEGFPSRLREKVQSMHAATPVAFIVLGVFISLIHSWLEEYYWRGFLLSELTCVMSWRWAIPLSSFAFMAHHVVVLGAYIDARHWWVIALFSFSVALGGAFWAWQYMRFRSLMAPWLSHLVIDAALMLVGYEMLFGW